VNPVKQLLQGWSLAGLCLVMRKAIAYNPIDQWFHICCDSTGDQLSCLATASSCTKSFITHTALPPRATSSKYYYYYYYYYYHYYYYYYYRALEFAVILIRAFLCFFAAVFWPRLVYFVGVSIVYWFAGRRNSVTSVSNCSSQECRELDVNVLLTWENSLVLSRNVTLASILQHLLRRLQFVMNTTAQVVYLSSRFDHITPLIHQLHWLKTKERIVFKLAVLAFKCSLSG